jgi:hypothetical protein
MFLSRFGAGSSWAVFGLAALRAKSSTMGLSDWPSGAVVGQAWACNPPLSGQSGDLAKPCPCPSIWRTGCPPTQPRCALLAVKLYPFVVACRAYLTRLPSQNLPCPLFHTVLPSHKHPTSTLSLYIGLLISLMWLECCIHVFLIIFK